MPRVIFIIFVTQGYYTSLKLYFIYYIYKVQLVGMISHFNFINWITYYVQ